jgi:hypothetical protein
MKATQAWFLLFLFFLVFFDFFLKNKTNKYVPYNVFEDFKNELYTKIESEKTTMLKDQMDLDVVFYGRIEKLKEDVEKLKEDIENLKKILLQNSNNNNSDNNN